jgi:hypothetical protein
LPSPRVLFYGSNHDDGQRWPLAISGNGVAMNGAGYRLPVMGLAPLAKNTWKF